MPVQMTSYLIMLSLLAWIVWRHVLPYWHEVLAPAIFSGQRVPVAARGNLLRALVKYLDGISDEAIAAKMAAVANQGKAK